MKAMSLFSRTFGDIKINTLVLLFGIYDSYVDDRATHILQPHHISPFILKSGDSTNNQPNYNGTNLKLNRYYGIAKVKWQRHHGTIKFTASHMNSILVEMFH